MEQELFRVLLVGSNERRCNGVLKLLVSGGSVSYEVVTKVGLHAFEREELKTGGFDAAILEAVEQPRTVAESILHVMVEKGGMPVILVAGAYDKDQAVWASRAGAADCIFLADLNPVSLDRSLRLAILAGSYKKPPGHSEQRQGEISALLKGAKAVLEYQDFKLAARSIFAFCKEVTGATVGYVALLNEKKEENEVLFLDAGGMACTVNQSLPMPIRGLREKAFVMGRPVFENSFMESQWKKWLPKGHVPLKNVLLAPLSHEGRVVGLLGVANKPTDFTHNDARMAAALGEMASIALRNSFILKSLERSEARFRQLSDNIHVVFWITTLDNGRLIYVNKAYEQLWGRSCRSLHEDPKSRFEAVHAEDRHLLMDWLGQGRNMEFEVKEYRIVRPDGSICWVRDRFFPVRNAEGEIYRIAGIAEDITEEKRLRQESELRLQQVIQTDKLASLGEVVAGVAHEINNPNSFITYNTPLLEETWGIFEPIIQEFAAAHPQWHRGRLSLEDLCQDMREIIEAIKTGSDRINNVVTNLKDFARLDESVHTKPVQLNEIIEKTMTIIGAQLRRCASVIEMELDPDLPQAEGHFQKLEQVMANLLLNATHAIESKERGRICITTRYSSGLGCVLVDVEDNGRGIEQDVLHRVFDPFFTTRRASGGTGLGLSVSHALVQEHHGLIGVLSRPGRGTKFTVILPLEHGPAPDLSPTILCVDDDIEFLNMLRMQFLRVNTPVEFLLDPKNVVAYLEEHPEIDMVLCDLLMPNMDGWELLGGVKRRFPLLPVIMYSGHIHMLNEAPALIPEPDYVLEKPFSMKQLVEVVQKIGRMKL